MSNVALILNNTLLDLDPDERISMNFQAGIGDKIGEILTSYTNTFTLPPTANNHTAFEGAAHLPLNTLVPYKQFPCSLLINGRDLFGISKLVLLETDGESYKVAFIAGQASSVMDGSIKDLNLASHNFVFNPANVAARAANTTGVIWSPVNFGVDLTPGNMDCERMSFAVYFHTIIAAIFSKANINVIIKNQGSTLYNRMVLFADLPVAIPAQVDGLSFTAVRTIPQVAPAGITAVIIFNSVTLGNEAGYYNPANGNFTVPHSNYLTAQASITLNVIAVGTKKLELAFNAVSFVETNLEVTALGPVEIQIAIDVPYGIRDPYILQARITSNSADTITAGSFNVLISPRAYLGNTIDAARSLPDMKCNDFFKQIATIANLIVDAKGNECVVMAFDRINQSDAYDWSQKLDTSKADNTNYQSSMGRITRFLYDNDDYAPSKTAGGAQVNFDNDLLEPSKDYATLMFSAARDATFLGITNTMLVPMFKIEDAGGPGTSSRNGGAGSSQVIFSLPHGLRTGDYISIPGAGILKYIWAVLSPTVVDTLPVAPLPNFTNQPWFKKTFTKQNLKPRIGFAENALTTGPTIVVRSSYNPLTSTFTQWRRVFFVGPTSEGLTWGKLLRNFFTVWLGSVERYKLVRAWFKLNDDDTYKFDFTNKVSVDKYGQSFYVQKISGYSSDGESVQAEIMPIGQVLDPAKIIDLT